MTDQLLIIFTRNPEQGKVKTRLAQTIGDEPALAVYNILLKHTKEVVKDLPSDKTVYYSSFIDYNDLWDSEKFDKKVQTGNDLGAKMYNAFGDAFQDEYAKVVLIGSDLIDLSAKHIEDAFEALTKNDIVLGPAHDGGYYLIGLKKIYRPIFENKEWGTSTVFQSTMNDLKTENVFLLDELNDVDTYDDLKAIPQLKDFLLRHDKTH